MEMEGSEMAACTRRSLFAGSAALAAFAGLSALPEVRLTRAQGAATYDLVDFGAFVDGVRLPNGSRLLYGGATGIANDGTSFGKIAVSEERFSPALWSPEGKVKRLKSSTFGGVINALNAGGDAAGQLFAEINGGNYQTLNKPVAWIGGDMNELPMPDPAFAGGEMGGTATGISDDGVIVGSGNGYQLRWVNGAPEIVTAPDQARISTLLINSKGEMATSVSSSQGADQVQKVARFDGTNFTVLDPPPGTEQYGQSPVAINNDGVILAYVYIVDVFVAVLYGNDKTTLLDLRDSGGTFIPRAFNDKNEVIGSWQAHFNDKVVQAIWRGTEPEDLSAQVPESSGLKLAVVTGINSDGIICGTATDEDFAVHPILLVPAS